MDAEFLRWPVVPTQAATANAAVTRESFSTPSESSCGHAQCSRRYGTVLSEERVPYAYEADDCCSRLGDGGGGLFVKFF
jgi:hypothetical protein